MALKAHAPNVPELTADLIECCIEAEWWEREALRLERERVRKLRLAGRLPEGEREEYHRLIVKARTHRNQWQAAMRPKE